MSDSDNSSDSEEEARKLRERLRQRKAGEKPKKSDSESESEDAEDDAEGDEDEDEDEGDEDEDEDEDDTESDDAEGDKRRKKAGTKRAPKKIEKKEKPRIVQAPTDAKISNFNQSSTASVPTGPTIPTISPALRPPIGIGGPMGGLVTPEQKMVAEIGSLQSIPLIRAVDVDDLLVKGPTEDDQMYNYRVALTKRLNLLLLPQSAVVAAHMYINKARTGVKYEDSVERALTILTSRVNELPR